MNDKQRTKWERTRAKGMRRFVLLNTVIMCAVMLISTSVFDYFFSFYGVRAKDLYFKVPIYAVSGLIFGLAMWFIAEYNYKKTSTNAHD
jgi:hypothetical protein